MAINTDYYKLQKPELDEKYNILVYNDSLDKIDTLLNRRIPKVQNAIANNVAILSNDGSVIDSTKSILDVSNTFVVNSLPQASEKYVNKYLFYVGETTTDFTANCFYKCVFNSAANLYSWNKLSSGLTYTPLGYVDSIPGI